MKGHRYRAIFISDVHLGTSACQAEYLIDFLTENHADTLYLVGDIIDFLAMRKRIYFTPQHEEVLLLIMKKARTGTRVVYIPGNHDAFFRRFCGQTIAGIEVRFSAVHQALTGERYYVSHGDEFDGIMQCSDWLNWLADVSHGFLLKLNTLVNLIRKCFKLPYWSLARSVKKRIGKATEFIHQFERIASLQARVLDEYSFPSGHTLHTVTFAVVMTAYSPLLAPIFVPIAILTGVSRVILGVHFPSDVLCGVAMGLIHGSIAVILMGWIGLV